VPLSGSRKDSSQLKIQFHLEALFWGCRDFFGETFSVLVLNLDKASLQFQATMRSYRSKQTELELELEKWAHFAYIMLGLN
jgi:hypothetical protein